MKGENKKRPERAGTRFRAGQIEGRIIKMSSNKIITFFERRQYRRVIVLLIEGIILAGIIRCFIVFAAMLLKGAGVL